MRAIDEINDGADGPVSGSVPAVEGEQRLSRSILWKLQKGYFHRTGIEAWRTTTVPHYATNNPALAHAYAAVVFGLLRDAAASGLDPEEPFTILELGAGSGRFGYLFLKAFIGLHRRSPLAGVPFRYIMTDFTRTNLAFLQSHESLRPFVEQGILDFATFDVEDDREIVLQHAGARIAPGSLHNPLAVVANYVFDVVSQDAFWVEDGRLHECLVSLSSHRGEVDLEDPEILSTLAPRYTRRAAPLDYYDDPDLDGILREYVERGREGTVLFPCAAIRCLRRLSALSSGGLMLLSGDRGDGREDAAVAPAEPSFTVHGGCFSMDVNYHAIGRYVASGGGLVLRTAHRHAYLNVSAFLLGGRVADRRETALAFDQGIERGGPDDFFTLRRGIEGGYARLDLPEVLSLIRLSRFDPRILRDCLPVLSSCLGAIGEAAKEELVSAVLRVWDNHYPIGEDFDLAFELGQLLHGAGAQREALAMFSASIRLSGDDPRTQWNLGLCHFALGEPDEGARRFREAARLHAGFHPEGGLLSKRAAA